jgi:hypothetical protein
MHLSRAVWLAALSLMSLPGCTKTSRESGAVVTEVGTAPTPPHNPKELGWVHWQRDFEAASAEARASGKPLFVLFQEVPGCATCVGFGESVLSHPLVIEAIEAAFVPVAIHNNAGGADRRVLERFGEPAWNNPVVRFVGADGRELIERADGVWSTHGIAERMVKALAAAGREVPDYLGWAVEETASFERATFAMYCFWSGEACLGDLPGVIATRAGMLDGREVVEVDYDRARLTAAALRAQAEERGCGEMVAGAKPARNAGEGDSKFHLERSRMRFLPLTSYQASRVNAALAKRLDAERWLSPRQRSLWQQVAAAAERALDGLEPPDETRQLAHYEHLLRERLASR